MPPPGSEPFLRAICANPADDAPRLVYADWLDENGAAERAEFIRVQIAITHANVKSSPLLAERFVALSGLAETIWRQELSELFGIYWRDFNRGFVNTVDFNAPLWFFKHGSTAFASTPIQHMQLHGLRHDHIERFAASELLTHIESFTILTNIDWSWRDDWALLTTSPHLKQLRHFHLVGNIYGPDSYASVRWDGHVPPPQAFLNLEEFRVTGLISDETSRQLQERFGKIFRHDPLR